MKPLVGFAGLGDTAAWYGLAAAPEEIYLWRAVLSGARLADASDALAVVAAVGAGQDRDLDVRGIAVGELPEGSLVDVVLSSPKARVYPPVVYDDAADIALKVAADAALRQRFPSLSVERAELLQLVGPPDALDFWRAHAVLWSAALGQQGKGGPTSTFAQSQGVYRGTAEDGPRAAPVTVDKPGLAPPAPSQSSHAVWFALGGVVLAWLVIRAL